MVTVKPVTAGIVGPYERHCAGAPLSSGNAYISAPVIAVVSTPLADASVGPTLLDRTIAFDMAEAAEANVTQTNMVQVSSFCGERGLVLGCDLLPQPISPHPLLAPETFPQVCDLEPLLAATKALLGTVREPRFPIKPGQHLLCAYKSLFAEGPCTLYGSLAVALPEDRFKNADLFMEDLGTWTELSDRSEVNGELHVNALNRLVDSVRRVGDNLGVNYSRIYVGIRSHRVPQGEIGCALTAAPYVQLARSAVPQSSTVDELQRMSVHEWESSVGSQFVSRKR